MIRAALRLGWITALWCVGCERSFTDPVAPDTSQLAESYEAPDGLLSSDTLPAAAQAFFTRVQSLDRVDRFALLERLSDDIARATAGRIDEDGASSRVAAVVKAQRACAPPADADVPRGKIKMTLKGSTRGIYPIVWGSFEQCLVRSGGLEITVDGDYTMTLTQGPGGRATLYQFDGTVDLSGVMTHGELDFRLLADGTLELRIAARDGDVVLGLDPRGDQSARDRIGRWQCALQVPRCERADQVIGP